MKIIINSFLNGFFRSLGRILAYLVIGGIFALIMIKIGGN